MSQETAAESTETAVVKERTPQDTIDRNLPLEDHCCRCRKMIPRTKVFYDTYHKDEPGVTATYECQPCGYTQGLKMTGSFVTWYLKEFKVE
jgi:hypothetical protein